jgi:citrate synthase
MFVKERKEVMMCQWKRERERERERENLAYSGSWSTVEVAVENFETAEMTAYYIEGRTPQERREKEQRKMEQEQEQEQEQLGRVSPTHSQMIQEPPSARPSAARQELAWAVTPWDVR